MIFSGMSVFDVFFPFKWLVSADSPMLEMSTSFMHTMHRALCLSPLTSRSHSLYGDFWSHKLLKTHLLIVLNLSLVKQNANNQHQPKQGQEALNAHDFSQKERIVQTISLALNIPDIQPIRAMSITKNRTNVHGAFDRRSEWCYLLSIGSFTITCCYVSASSIYFHTRHSRI